MLSTSNVIFYCRTLHILLQPFFIHHPSCFRYVISIIVLTITEAILAVHHYSLSTQEPKHSEWRSASFISRSVRHIWQSSVNYINYCHICIRIVTFWSACISGYFLNFAGSILLVFSIGTILCTMTSPEKQVFLTFPYTRHEGI